MNVLVVSKYVYMSSTKSIGKLENRKNEKLCWYLNIHRHRFLCVAG